MPEFVQLQNLLDKYFPDSFSGEQLDQFEKAFGAYLLWNEQINVISRKDIENLPERHFLHALALKKALDLKPGTRIIDAGTGGGFPGIPLAIAFPEVEFLLVDSVSRKIKVVEEIVQTTGLKNVQYKIQRVEKIKEQADFVTGRAVTAMGKLIPLVRKRIHCRSRNSIPNGLLYLKGGEEAELKKEANGVRRGAKVFSLSEWFDEAFFSSKFLVHIPFCE